MPTLFTVPTFHGGSVRTFLGLALIDPERVFLPSGSCHERVAGHPISAGIDVRAPGSGSVESGQVFFAHMCKEQCFSNGAVSAAHHDGHRRLGVFGSRAAWGYTDATDAVHVL